MIDKSFQNNDFKSLNEVCFILSNLSCNSSFISKILKTNIIDLIIQETIKCSMTNAVSK